MDLHCHTGSPPDTVGETSRLIYHSLRCTPLSTQFDSVSLVPKRPVALSLTSIASRNLLLYQSLTTSIQYRHAMLRRRKDDTCVGPVARGINAPLYLETCCPMCHARMPKRSPPWSMSSAWSCKTSLARRPGTTGPWSRYWSES